MVDWFRVRDQTENVYTEQNGADGPKPRCCGQKGFGGVKSRKMADGVPDGQQRCCEDDE